MAIGLGSQVLCTSMKGVRAVCLPPTADHLTEGVLLFLCEVLYCLPTLHSLFMSLSFLSIEASCLCACFTDPGRDAQHFPSSVFSAPLCSMMSAEVATHRWDEKGSAF